MAPVSTVAAWSSADVQQWLGGNGHALFAPALARMGFTGSDLLGLSAQTLELMGIPPSAAREWLLEDVDELKGM